MIKDIQATHCTVQNEVKHEQKGGEKQGCRATLPLGEESPLYNDPSTLNGQNTISGASIRSNQGILRENPSLNGGLAKSSEMVVIDALATSLLQLIENQLHGHFFTSPYFTREEAAAYLKIEPKSVDYYSKRVKTLPSVSLGEKRLYRKADLDAFMETRVSSIIGGHNGKR